MRKILFLLLLLCSMTAAWAGEGNGSKEHPFSGEWTVNELQEKNLKEGMYLAHDCVITGGMITVDDSKLGERIATNWNRWDVGAPIRDYDDGSYANYEVYRGYNALEDREKHMFMVTGVKVDFFTLDLQGYYSGHYDRGDGTKDNPYWGEWLAGEIGQILSPGDYLAYDCKIVNGFVYVTDDRFDTQIAYESDPWCVGDDAIGDTPHEAYIQYCADNPNRKNHTFIVSSCNVSAYSSLNITGHYSGLYSTPDADGFVYVASSAQMWTILKRDDHAKVRLAQDIFLSDLGVESNTFCSTFYGTLDGDGHTIYGDHYGDDSTQRRDRNYLFTYSDGATIKNLTFKHIRKKSDEHGNQAIITSKAMNKCVFENITFDNVGTSSEGLSGSAAVTGIAEDCTFTNITVKNSDFYAEIWYSGAVAGEAKNCCFENISVENCESYADAKYAGGVAGLSKNCTFNHVQVLGSFIKADGEFAGGIAGASYNSTFEDCIIDDQSCVFVNGYIYGYVGGIVGDIGDESIIEGHDIIRNCVNSALIACDANYAGGIAGCISNTVIENCLNTGMVISIKNVDGYYSKYKNKQLNCVTKYYNGKEYAVRQTELGDNGDSYYGGITGGLLQNSIISKCANIGSMNEADYAGGLVGLFEEEHSSVTDCLSAFDSPSDKIKGLIGRCDDAENSTITNCVNATHAEDYDSDHGSTFVATNIFSYKRGSFDINELTWGKVCLSLGDNWQQNIGTEPYPTPTGDKAIYHSRTITNEYGTAYFPFAVDSDDNISFYTFKEETPGAEGINLKFTYVEHVPAHTPVLFRASGSPTPEDPVNITINDAHGDYVWRDKYIPASGWGMEGTYKQRVIDGNEAKSTYYLSGGVFKNAAKVNLPSCRAYLHGQSIDELTASGKSITFSLDDEDGTITALELVGDDLVPAKKNGKTYSLMGTEVGKGYRGIVIQNGRKTLSPALLHNK